MMNRNLNMDRLLPACGFTAALLLAVCVASSARAAESLPTLDDLLDLTGPAEQAPDEQPAEGDEAETAGEQNGESELNPEMLDELPEAGADQFQQALGLMEQAAGRIGNDMDPGVETQRLQEEVIEKLEQLIAQQSKKRPSSSSSGSSGGSQGQQSQQDQGSQQNANKQDQQPGNQKGEGQGRQQQKQTGEHGGDFSPGQQQRPQPEGGQMLENRDQWGNLPPRVRDQLMQGLNEKFSSVYEQMTRSYYRRLAQEQQE